MYIPYSTSTGGKPSQELPPEVIDARDSLLAALKDWNTCMAQTGCKVTAFLGIVAAIIIILSIVFFIVRVLWFGATIPCRLCFWACCSPRRNKRRVILVPSNQCYAPEHSRYTDHPEQQQELQPQQPRYTDTPAMQKPSKETNAYPHPVPNQQAFYIDDSAVAGQSDATMPPAYDAVVKAYHTEV